MLQLNNQNKQLSVVVWLSPYKLYVIVAPKSITYINRNSETDILITRDGIRQFSRG